MAKKALRWDDEQYRSLLKSVCGVDSAGDLNDAGRAKFLDHCRKCGWSSPYQRRGSAKPSRSKLPPKQAKIYSLWQELHAAGLVNDRSFKALESWCKGQTGVDKLEWHNDAQLVLCIESLKAWLSRKGASS